MIPDFINRNLLILFLCQMFFVAGSVLIATIGGIVGHGLAATASLATLPVAVMVVGTASATIPASLLMQRIGRRSGFILATVIAALGALLSGAAVRTDDFWLFCLGTTFVGLGMGFSQQFRFAAAESVTDEAVSYAVSFILLGSIAGAFIGPALVVRSVAADVDSPYTLAFNLLVGLYLAAGFALLLLKPFRDMTTSDEGYEEARPMRVVARQPLFFSAVLAGLVGQGVMTYVMTATPISMSVEHDFAVEVTSGVIRAHVIAMYLPSLVTPLLISRFGLARMMALGAAAMATTICIGLAGQHLMHYWFALVLLGVGWNFLFVSGTTQLVQSYRRSERFRAQALNDFSVFTVSAGASLLAGTVLFHFGWTTLLLSALPGILLFMLVLAWQWRSVRSPEATRKGLK